MDTDLNRTTVNYTQSRLYVKFMLKLTFMLISVDVNFYANFLFMLVYVYVNFS